MLQEIRWNYRQADSSGDSEKIRDLIFVIIAKPYPFKKIIFIIVNIIFYIIIRFLFNNPVIKIQNQVQKQYHPFLYLLTRNLQHVFRKNSFFLLH